MMKSKVKRGIVIIFSIPNLVKKGIQKPFTSFLFISWPSFETRSVRMSSKSVQYNPWKSRKHLRPPLKLTITLDDGKYLLSNLLMLPYGS